MEHAIAIGVCTLALIVITSLAAVRVAMPEAVVQTLAGVLLSFVPGISPVQLNADVVLLGVLPPLVYVGAVTLPWREFFGNIRLISSLAFGLVAVTIGAVALVAHAQLGLAWPAAFVLGAVVSPTDPVASSALAARMGVPRRLVAVLEGEGLVNDAVALTFKTLAIAALTAGHITAAQGVERFTVILVGEIAYGLAVGYCATRIRARIRDSRAEIVITLITPFVAYLVPESLGGSGVLATVAAGMYVGERRTEIAPSGTRLHLASVWDVIVYALNGSLFLLTGLQARSIWQAHVAGSPMLVCAVLVSVTAILLRLGWIWPASRLAEWLPGHTRNPDSPLSSRHLGFLGWSGMRGSISLAAALSIPATIEPRGTIVFITASVIAATLLTQGATAPWLVRRLRLSDEAEREHREAAGRELKLRVRLARAGLHALGKSEHSVAEELRRNYERLIERGSRDTGAPLLQAHRQLRKRAIEAERRCAVQLYSEGEMDDQILRRVERSLDLREAALDAEEPGTQ